MRHGSFARSPLDMACARTAHHNHMGGAWCAGPNDRGESTMKPIMHTVFAVFLAIAMLVGSAWSTAALAQVSQGDCRSFAYDDDFDGRWAFATCPWPSDMRIVVRCRNDTTEFYITTGEYMLERGISLRTALDGVETPGWSRTISTDNRSLFISPAIPTIKKLLGHSRLRVRITERDGGQHDANIDLSGLGEAIAPIRELCGW